MHRGYVKTWRKVLDSGWLKNHRLWVFWSYCILRASYQERNALIGNQEIHISPGQFIFGRKAAAEDCGMTERQIRTCLQSLSNLGNVTIKTTNKFSIISIINWETYQGNGNENDQQSDQQPVHNLSTTCHKQERKNSNKEKKERIIPDFVSPDVWGGFIEMRNKIKKPVTDYAARLIFKKLDEWKDQCDPNEILNQSIERCWQGVFLPEKQKGRYYGDD